MKPIIQKLWMVMAMLCLSISASAYDFEVDGFYYEVNLEKMTATLVAGENKQAGEITIPATVTYKGREFSVTSINGAFSGNEELTKVSLPPSIKVLGAETFNGCTKLSSISTLNHIVEIGEYCFSNCEELATVDLSIELKTIGNGAFNGCKILKEFIIPESVDTIGNKVFQNCSNLSKIILPSTIQYISDGLFRNCESLVNVEIPSSVTIIKDYAFDGCKSLESIVIPANVKKINNGVFNGCSSLKSVKLDDCEEPITLGYGQLTEKRVLGLFYNVPIESLYLGRDLNYPNNEALYLDAHYEGYAPFQSCNIREATIGKSVSRINPYTFYNCSNLNEIVIPTSVASIGVYAFAMSSIKSFTIKDGFSNISLGVTEGDDLTTLFMGCNHLKNIKIGRNCVVSEQKSQGWLVSNDLNQSLFPPTIENIEIGNYVDELSWLQLYEGKISSSLAHYPHLRNLHVGYCIKYLPSLRENKELSIITLCSAEPIDITLDDFSNSQFMDLAVFVPSESIKNYQENGVWNKFWDIRGEDNLHSNIVLNNKWMYGVIDESNKIELFKIPSTIETDIVIPEIIYQDNISYIVSSLGCVFKNNAQLITIDIPQSVEKLGAESFMNCSLLEKVNLKDGLKSIGAKTFYNCKKIKELSIPATVEHFGSNAFYGCEFESFTFEEGNTCLYFPYVQTKTSSLPGSGNYKIIHQGYFKNTIIRNLYIGRDLMNIPSPYIENRNDYNVFEDPFYDVAQLETIVIGSNVSKIGSDKSDPIYLAGLALYNHNSFGRCANLRIVNVKGINPPTGAEFSNITYSNATLIVPDNTISLFQVAEGWKEFKNIIDETSAGIDTIMPYNNFPVSLSYDGIIYEGEHDAFMLISGIDGKCQFSGNVSSGQSIALSKGIFIITLDGKSIKVKI